MRLFLALWPDEVVRAALSNWAAGALSVTRGRSMRAAGLHITVAFIGERPDESVIQVDTAMRSFDGQAFDMTLDTVRYWNHNRIVWCGPSVSPPELGRTVAATRDALTAARIPFDPKPFVPHVTMIRHAHGLPRSQTIAPILWRVDAVVLVSSTPSAGGSHYEVVRRWPLGA